ncbi:VanZ family protein [Agromyces archimandritae]|uniref:VanZ family protein n=1 Tax=Agromyces archimandritae TaxID=2781962 RepID=A0A975FQI0_9MICO|nr:VanZ family protein [Agromyces archimandritae]QTX05356.1 VanZ family protein [Agromyces archimandritae]
MDRILPGVVALVLGIPVLTLVFVPVVVGSYRRRGGFSAVRFIGWLSLPFYLFGLWAYTLLPFPEEGYRCVGVELDPTLVVTDILRLQGEYGLLSNPAVQQFALNVALFVPLGIYLRGLFGRGMLVSTLIGVGVSLLIEVTQLTGVWGLFPCAYRLFDTGDLLTNGLGTLLGAAAVAVLLRLRGRTRARVDAAPHMTAGRRILAMLVDLVGATAVSVAISIGINAVQMVLNGRGSVDEVAWLATLLGALVPFAIVAATVWASGATPGEHAVLIRAREGRRPRWWWRTVRIVFGIGGYLLLGLAPDPWSLLAWLLAAASLVAAFTTRGHRGLGQALAGMDAEVEPARASA